MKCCHLMARCVVHVREEPIGEVEPDEKAEDDAPDDGISVGHSVD